MHRASRYLRLWFALAAIAESPAERTPRPVRVGEQLATAFNFMPLTLGIKQGNFAKNSLDVEVVDLSGASKIYQAMISGSIDSPWRPAPTFPSS